MGKPKRGRNQKPADDADDEVAVDSIDQTEDTNEDTGGKAKGGKKKGKKDRKNKDWDVDDIVNEIEGLKVNDNKEADAGNNEPTTKSKKKKKGRKKDWDEDELLDDIAAIANDGGESNVTTTEEPEEPAPLSKKEKKKKGKKKDFDEDELIEEIASLEAEPENKPAPMAKKDKKKGKKGKKQDFDEDDLLDELAEIEAEMDGGKKPKQDEQEGEAESAKKKPTPKADEGDAAAAEEGGGVKTAAQKKAEKKERERKKKEQQRLEARNRKLKQEAKAKEEAEGGGETAKKDAGAAEDGAANDKDEAGAEEGDEEEVSDKKKKKKKKGKGEKEEKKKGVGKSQLKAMQEALQQMKAEEERLKAEEEAKIKAAEEAEKLRLEKLQKEKEKKEREKQKKKERIERQKKEGTYMTKAQKEAKARAEAMLAAMRASGIEVPTKDAVADAGPKRVRYGTRQRKNKKGQDQGSQEGQETETTTEADDATSPTKEGAEEKSVEETTGTAEEEKKEEEKKEKVEEVKDSWDMESEEEEEEEEEEKPTQDAVPTKEVTVKPKKEEEGEDDEEDEDDDEEEESSEEESDSEEEESSEEESSEEEEDKTSAEKIRERAMARIKKRREDAEVNRTTDDLRCPVVCVLGHVDTGKTKILDKIRHTNVQDGEAGGITQQIGATRVPDDTIKEQTKMCRQFAKAELKIPGLLIIDTPGHESFSNLRSRGSSLCDIAILVVDIMHGLEPQTIESLNLLKSRKTPFIVALNKIDRLFEWKSSPHTDVANVIKKQKKNTKDEFDERLRGIVTEFAEQGMNAAPFYDNPDPKSYVSLVPTSAHSGDGMGNLIALIVELSQTLLAKRLSFSENLQCTTLEVKALPGLGTTIDVVLVNGYIKEGDTMILAGQEGPIVTPVRGLLMPQPLKELRVKNQYEKYKELKGAQGIKILAKDLEKALAGMPLLVAQHPDEVEVLKEEVAAILKDALKSIKLTERGVFVQASTLGSLEALLEFLKTSKIPYAGINIGPVHKKDVMKASVMLEHDSQYAVILAFDVRVEREAQEMADREGIKIFQADIIYHLFDSFMAHREELRLKKREEYKHIAVFPCKLKILPQCIFNARNPIVMGVNVEGGIVKEGTPICIPSKDNITIGVISSLELNHKQVESARKGQEVCVKIEHTGGDAPKMFGRHFDADDLLISKISRESIDAVKKYFREDLEKSDWQVMIELKKILQIL